MEIWSYICKKFDEYEETETGQMVRRPETAAAEAEEAVAVRAAVRVGRAVQDAVQGGARVRPGDGRGTI